MDCRANGTIHPAARFLTTLEWNTEDIMRGVIIGLSALAFVGLPTMAFADGNGAVTGAAGGAVAGAVVGGPVGAAVGGAAGGIIGGVASGPQTGGRGPSARRAPVQLSDDDDDKQQYRRERHQTYDRLS